MGTWGLNLQAPMMTKFKREFRRDKTNMASIARDPVVWMSMTGLAGFAVVHGTLLLMLLRAGL
jgi:hypothetical protein